MSSPSGRVLVYGGRGALGSVVVETFKKNKWWTCNVDLCSNDNADVNVVVSESESLVEQAEKVTNQVQSAIGENKFDAILCVAGGWAGGNAKNKDFIKNTDLMVKQSVWTSVISAQLASKCLKEGGLLQLTGAVPALSETPGMMGYGLAKAAVHQLVSSLSANGNGLPTNTTTLAILPVTLDTPQNRHGMPNADHSNWTSLEFVSNILHEWAQSAGSRPVNGTLVKLITQSGKTELVPANL